MIPLISSNDDVLDFLSNPFAKSFKLIGFSDKNDYYRLIKKIYDKSLNIDNCVFISEMLPIIKDTSLMNYLISEINNFDIYNLDKEEIVLDSNDVISYKIKLAICSNWNKLLKSSYFNSNNINDNIKKSVLCSLIIYTYTLLKMYDFNKTEKPRMIFYGELNEINSYVLNILNDSEFKIMYINSDKDNINLLFESYQLKSSSKMLLLNDLLNKAKELEEISVEKVETIGKNYKEGYSKYLFDGIKTFEPRQIFHLDNKIVHIDCILEDLNTYWYEENRIRPSFKVENNTVYTPNFFIKINGVYNKQNKYKELIKSLSDREDYTNFITKIKISDLVKKRSLKDDEYSLVYVIENFKINEDRLKSNKIYSLSRYNIDLQNRIINKLNDFLYRRGFKSKDYVQEDFIYLILNVICNNSIIKVLENFDYPFKVPKLIIYDERGYSTSKIDIMMLEFLNTLGIDIVIISPFGNYFIENNIKSYELSTFSLDLISESFDINSIININSKKGLFKSLFG